MADLVEFAVSKLVSSTEFQSSHFSEIYFLLVISKCECLQSCQCSIALQIDFFIENWQYWTNKLHHPSIQQLVLLRCQIFDISLNLKICFALFMGRTLKIFLFITFLQFEVLQFSRQFVKIFLNKWNFAKFLSGFVHFCNKCNFLASEATFQIDFSVENNNIEHNLGYCSSVFQNYF